MLGEVRYNNSELSIINISVKDYKSVLGEVCYNNSEFIINIYLYY